MLKRMAEGHYSLHGCIDMQEKSALLKELLALSPEGSVRLDVGAVDKADSLLLAALLDVQRRFRQAGQSLCIQGMPAAMQGLLHVYGIEDLLDIQCLPDNERVAVTETVR